GSARGATGRTRAARGCGVRRDLSHNERRLLLHSRGVAVPMSSNPIVVAHFSLQPFFFNGLQEGGALLGPWGSIRPRNPRRAIRDNTTVCGRRACDRTRRE